MVGHLRKRHFNHIEAKVPLSTSYRSIRDAQKPSKANDAAMPVLSWSFFTENSQHSSSGTGRDRDFSLRPEAADSKHWMANCCQYCMPKGASTIGGPNWTFHQGSIKRVLGGRCVRSQGPMRSPYRLALPLPPQYPKQQCSPVIGVRGAAP